MDAIILTGIAVGSLAFGTEMLADRRLPVARRIAVSACFALAGFASGVGIFACYLFHDGILPDDQRLSGWPALLSFGRAFALGPALLACPLIAAGLLLRKFPPVPGQKGS